MNAGYACPCIITELPARTGLCGILYCTVVRECWVMMDYFIIPCHSCTLVQAKPGISLNPIFCYKSMHSYM